MKFNLYKDSYENLKLSIKMLTAIVIVLLIIITGLVVFYSIKLKKVQYVIVPPTLKEKVYIGDEFIDKKYLLAMGYFIGDLVGSFSPNDFDKRVNILLGLTYPDYQGVLKSILIKNRKFIKANKVYQMFVITDLDIDFFKEKRSLAGQNRVVSPVKGELGIEGIAVRKLGSSAPIWGTNLSIRVKYWVKNGVFQIIGLKVKENKVKQQNLNGA